MGKGVCYFIRVTNEHSQRRIRSLRADANSLLHVKRHVLSVLRSGFGVRITRTSKADQLWNVLYSRVEKLSPFFLDNGIPLKRSDSSRCLVEFVFPDL